MNRNQQFVIAINRELGSGGRTVGRKLAEKLGVPYHDKAVSITLEEEYQLTTEQQEELKGQNHGRWIQIKRSDGRQFVDDRIYQVNPSEEDAQERADQLFRTEQEALQRIADEASCVVAGRSAFYAFRNHPNHLSVLIQASMEERVARVARKQQLSDDEARQLIERIDTMRENYVSSHTGTSRYDTRNYDLVLRADGKTEDQLVDIILHYIDAL